MLQQQVTGSTAARIGAENEITEFIGIREVCRIAGFSKSSILRRIKSGVFPRAVIAEGNCVRFDKAEVMKWRLEQFKKREQREVVRG